MAGTAARRATKPFKTIVIVVSFNLVDRMLEDGCDL